jgi:hypothetical protein
MLQELPSNDHCLQSHCSATGLHTTILFAIFFCISGSASVARGLSKYLDSLLNETMEQTFLETMPMATDSLALSPYFDIFAFGISFILAGMH